MMTGGQSIVFKVLLYLVASTDSKLINPYSFPAMAILGIFILFRIVLCEYLVSYFLLFLVYDIFMW